jgi:hypothetical protein
MPMPNELVKAAACSVHDDAGLAPRTPAEGVLINPSWEQMVERDPLIAFSWYLSSRKNVLLGIAAEIVENLDVERFDRAESLMWLWTLGAYEVVRTMCQAKTCFSKRAWEELAQLKKSLTAVRMPAAKMEKPGKKLPVTSNRSAAGWDFPNRDLLVNDPETTPDVSARFLLREFDRVFSSISKADVLGTHKSSYGNILTRMQVSSDGH